MPRHFERLTLRYSAEQMYDLVSDVERYPDFLPWCMNAHVYDRKERQFKADMTVGNNHFKDSFTSIVHLEPKNRIKVEYGGGALKHLVNEWDFIPLAEGRACEICFLVDFTLKSRLLGMMMDVFFQKAFQTMVHSFEEQAKTLYGILDNE